ncbi:MAG TPA: family 78 glycoside hydrolase catalytic domain [Candidatus Aminicenantes bacterium]|nr:family 78 glycoside hydrolase catalytic domain [Candidatus Aminicenantes bacterium]HRY65312.1 family 78 glycoside hydrolase catalytic domain [Candidatus Aminicenantes bacterium]HRZ72220.1 family 78 glycoside hydrolase catalytic domain [Candidatus Aminicenantes bacterium]
MTPLPPTRLRCEYLAEPCGLDTPAPRFFWRVESRERGDRPTAVQVLVSSDPDLLRNGRGDLWDTGRIEPPAAGPGLEYAGGPLASCARYFWKVRWWDREGRPSPWSEPASFVTGFLRPGDWQAGWIGAARTTEFRTRGTVLLGQPGPDETQYCAVYLRREFALRGRPALAMIFISGLGHYELRLNGARVGTSVLDPGWTDYRKKALYASHDVTALVRDRNAVGVILGNGRHTRSLGYDAPKLACRIEVEYEAGGREVFCADESWRTSDGPVRENGLYFGERCDARILIDGWDRPGFDDRGWEPAVAVTGYPLAAQALPPVRVTETLKPLSVRRLAGGAAVYDFGQNFSGWTRLRVEGPAGTEVRLRHAELLNEDGTLNFGPNENAEAADVYILRGGGPEVHEPKFTYHGFRYVEMTGYPGEPGPGALEGLFVHSDVEPAGAFRSSNGLIDAVHRNVLWGQLSNLMSIPTDCPQRDERHGWLGDAHLSAEEAVFNFDMAAFYAKFLDDIRLAQKEDGSLPDVAPAYLPRLYPADPAWSSAYATLVELLWDHYGDRRTIAGHYPALKRYIDFLGRSADGHIVRTLGKYGDWCPPGGVVPKKTPVELTSTWYYYHDVLIMARLAGVLGRDAEAREYGRLAESIKEAFNRAFLGESQYAAIRVSPVDHLPNQTSNALPLYLDMVPPDRKDKVVASLVQSVVRVQDCHVDTGILGTRYILDVLTENGQAETAFRVATQKSYPGWGYMIAEGATTLWERWEKLAGFAMNSQNHIMLGSIDAWFYRVLAGLSPLRPGWRKIRIRPHVLGDLSFVEASLETVSGRVSAGWKREGETFTLEASVPVGSEGEVHVPLLRPGARITESGQVVRPAGRVADAVAGLAPAGGEAGWAVFNVGSGTYRFELTA